MFYYIFDVHILCWLHYYITNYIILYTNTLYKKAVSLNMYIYKNIFFIKSPLGKLKVEEMIIYTII